MGMARKMKLKNFICDNRYELVTYDEENGQFSVYRTPIVGFAEVIEYDSKLDSEPWSSVVACVISQCGCITPVTYKYDGSRYSVVVKGEIPKNLGTNKI